MRRLISYLLLGAATLVGVGASIAPTILGMDTDKAYSDGRTLYFKASEWENPSLNGNYGVNGQFLDFEDPTLPKQPIEYIADTVRARLDAFELTGYSVETQGADTIAVTVRSPRNNPTIYTYLERYLSFSGGDYELDASDITKDGYAYNDKWTDIIDGQTATIVDMEQQGYNVPTVVIPLKSGEDYKEAFLNLVDYCKKNSSEGDDQSQGSTVTVIVWANRVGDTDLYADATSNPNVAAKILAGVSPANAVYYASSDADQTTPYLRLIPNSDATSGENYDPSKTQEAYDAARNLMLTFNAGAFQYEELKAAGESEAPKFNLTYVYSEKVAATVEKLVNNGDNFTQTVAMSSTFIAFGVAAILLVVLLAIFERILAVLEISVVAISTLSAVAVFSAFGSPFGLPALLGIAATALISLFGTLYYSAKLKEELYKGRTLKKAHGEAVKKALLPTVDVNVVTILLGICLYGLAGDVVAKLGVMLVLGGFFSLIATLLYTRFGGWLLTSDNTVAERFGKMLRVQPTRIPDLAKQEKQTYFGAYANSKFSKGKTIALIFSSLLLVAGVGASIGFGAASGGTSFFNTSAYESGAPILRIDVRSNASDRITATDYSEISSLLDETYKEGEPTDIFHTYKINGSFLADYVSDIRLSKQPHSVYVDEGSTGITYYWFYYEAVLGKKDASAISNAIKNKNQSTLEIAKWDGTDFVVIPGFALPDLAGDMIDGASTELSSGVGAFSDAFYITFENVVPADLTPYLWQVTLALGIASATILVYLALRYRPSRGIVAGLFGAGTATVAVSFFILTRISTLPVVSMAGAAVLLLTIAIAIFVMAGEKEIYRESKEKDKDNVEFRANCLESSASRSAEWTFLFALVSAITFISYLAFGPNPYQPTFLGVILGIAFAVALVITSLPFLSGKLARIMPSFTLPSWRKRKRKAAKQGGQLMKKNKNGEPEESIFIGIND